MFFFVIFGTKGVTRTADRGRFFCPRCGSEQDYEHKRVRRFFTLFFIPLIPLDRVGEYVECESCKGTFEPRVLSFDPGEELRSVEAEFQKATRELLVLMLLADGRIESSEVRMICDIYPRVTGTEITEDAVQGEVFRLSDLEPDVPTLMAPYRGVLNDEGREAVVKAALLVALADGEMDRSEARLLDQVAEALGMTSAHYEGVLSSVMAGAG